MWLPGRNGTADSFPVTGSIDISVSGLPAVTLPALPLPSSSLKELPLLSSASQLGSPLATPAGTKKKPSRSPLAMLTLKALASAAPTILTPVTLPAAS